MTCARTGTAPVAAAANRAPARYRRTRKNRTDAGLLDFFSSSSAKALPDFLKGTAKVEPARGSWSQRTPKIACHSEERSDEESAPSCPRFRGADPSSYAGALKDKSRRSG